MDINTPEISIKQAIGFLRTLIDLRQPAFMHGAPGIGKSKSIELFCKEQGYKLEILMLAQIAVFDLRGLPYNHHVQTVDQFNQAVETVISKWSRPDFLPEASDTIHILFLDELTAASPDVQVAAYQLLNDRRVGPHKLPDNVYVMGAGNRPDDGAIAYEMGTALADRLLHINLRVDSDAWLEHGSSYNFHPYVLAFIASNPSFLSTNQGQATKGQLVQPTPRSWERVSNVLYKDDSDAAIEVLVAGLVGSAAAGMLKDSIVQIRDLPAISEYFKATSEQIKKTMTPMTMPALYGLAFSLYAYAKHSSRLLRQCLTIMDAACERKDDLYRRETQGVLNSLVLNHAKAEAERAGKGTPEEKEWLSVLTSPEFRAIAGQVIARNNFVNGKS